MIFKLKGGGTVSGPTSRAVVQDLLMRSPFIARNEQAGMQAIARRCHVWNRSNIPTTNARTFLAALEAAGFLYRQKEH